MAYEGGRNKVQYSAAHNSNSKVYSFSDNKVHPEQRPRTILYNEPNHVH